MRSQVVSVWWDGREPSGLPGCSKSIDQQCLLVRQVLGTRHTCQLGLLGSGLASEGLGRVSFLSLACQASTSQLKGVAGPGSQEAKAQLEEKRGRQRALWTKRLSEGRFSEADLGGE